MTFINTFLNNREIAIVIWLGVFFLFALFQKSIRKSLIPIFGLFTEKVILISTIVMLLYIGAIIYFFYRINYWNISLLSVTIVWVVGVAFAMFININHTREDGYFRKAIWDNIKFVVIVEFVTNLYVFDLWAELILVPIMAILGGVLGIASTNPKYKQVETYLTKIVGLIGIGLIIYTLYNLVIDFREFATIKNLKEFLLPLIFTILFLPFIYILAVYVAYDMMFFRIKHLIKNPSLSRYAKWKSIFAFHLNLRALNKWLSKIGLAKLDSKDDIKQSIINAKMNNA